MLPPLLWFLIPIALGALLLGRGSAALGRRFVLGLAACSLIAWASGRGLNVPGLEKAAVALAELAGLHLVVSLLFFSVLRKFSLPRIGADLLIGAGYIVVLVALLAEVGVNVTGLIATSAVATAVVAFALQDMLSNLMGGVALQLERSIVEGDWLQTERGTGQVRSVRIRHTALETPDGNTILMPNSYLTKTPVMVLGRGSAGAGGPARYRKLVQFAADYRVSPAAVIELVDKALSASPMEGILPDPRPRCVLVEFEPGCTRFGVLVWLGRPALEYLDLSTVRARVAAALERGGVALAAVPHQIHLTDGSLMPGADPRIAALRGIEVLSVLTDQEIRQLAPRLRHLSYAPGEVILHQGDEGDCLYVVARGRVRVLYHSESGLAEPLATLDPGDFFGEMSLLTGERRNATALAEDPAECYRLDKADFAALIEVRPELAAEMADLIARRQTGLEAARERLDAEAERLQRQKHKSDLLSRIRRYFGLG